MRSGIITYRPTATLKSSSAHLATRIKAEWISSRSRCRIRLCVQKRDEIERARNKNSSQAKRSPPKILHYAESCSHRAVRRRAFRSQTDMAILLCTTGSREKAEISDRMKRILPWLPLFGVLSPCSANSSFSVIHVIWVIRG